jgi:NADH-quinone oxidoreductase subunit L
LFLLPLLTVSLTGFYMFRLWFLTFTGEPRHDDLHQQAEESPPIMTVPLILLALLSVGLGWGLQPWDPESSWLQTQLRLARPSTAPPWHLDEVAGVGHVLVPILAIAMTGLGLLFALQLYYFRSMSSADSKRQFPAVHSFLLHKWYFDEIYWALFAQPTLIIGRRLQWFDRVVLDGFIYILARFVVLLSRWDGFFDRYLVDGVVNLIGTVVAAVGGWLRGWETGSLRNSVLFLVLAALGVFLVLVAL